MGLSVRNLGVSISPFAGVRCDEFQPTDTYKIMEGNLTSSFPSCATRTSPTVAV